MAEFLMLLASVHPLALTSRFPTVCGGVFFFYPLGESFFRVPYEVVKQRLQVGAYPSTAVALKSIYRQVKPP